MKHSSILAIHSVIHNRRLASGLYSSISGAAEFPGFSSNAGKTVWKVFSHASHAAIRDIEQHPRGEQFRQLIEFGPLNPGEPEKLTSDNTTILSDPECAQCIEFIYSFMVNRFKGELAELLALQPCIDLLKMLQNKSQLVSEINLFWGDDIKEKSRLKINEEGKVEKWGGFTKGADGLIVKLKPNEGDSTQKNVVISGVVEIKSMHRSTGELNRQINRLIHRLPGGVAARPSLPISSRCPGDSVC